MNMMIFRFWSMLGWSLILWGELFIYTILTIENNLMLYRAISIASMFFTICLFIIFISCGDTLTGKIETTNQRMRKYQEMKSWILFAVWAAIITVVVFFKTIELVNSLFVLIYISTTAILTSIVWCVVSRAKQISDASWHWYVWSIITFIAVYGFYGYSFDNFIDLTPNGTVVQNGTQINQVRKQNNAVSVFVGISVVFVFVQVIYIYYVCRNQNPGHRRCLHLCRIIEGSTLAMFSMISCLLFIYGTMTFRNLEFCVIVTEIALLVFLLGDAFIVFRNDYILTSGYVSVNNDDINP
jgi:cytochrome bd-type quinol oxidase subunit 2